MDDIGGLPPQRYNIIEKMNVYVERVYVFEKQCKRGDKIPDPHNIIISGFGQIFSRKMEIY